MTRDEAYAAIKAAAAVNNNDGPRTLAFAAIRDGQNWNDRRLPEMGRALDAALDILDALVAERDGLWARVEQLEQELRVEKEAFRDLEADVKPLEARVEQLEAALRDLLDVAERARGGDPSLDSEEWYAARDFARAALSGLGDAG